MEETTDNKEKHWYPSEGWAVFYNTDTKVHEIQRIDELEILESDEEAVKLAVKKGFKVGTETNPFEVTGYPA